MSLKLADYFRVGCGLFMNGWFVLGFRNGKDLLQATYTERTHTNHASAVRVRNGVFAQITL